MDKARFDSLTRAMAIGKSRRDMLKLLAGGAAGGALAVTVTDNHARAACHGLACGAGCCAGTTCQGGVCVAMAAPAPAAEQPAAETTTVTTPPKTGIGPAGSDSSAWIGIAAAGGAAALLGSRFMRKDTKTSEDSA